MNVQITAMISTIEFLFYVIHQLWARFAGGTNQTGVFFAIVWYMFLFMIISPYSFLMNTSHNKNRIIDDGWINVLKNITINSSALASITQIVCCKKHDSHAEGNDIQENGNVEENTGTDNNSAIDQINSSHDRPTTTPNSNEEDENRTITCQSKTFVNLRHGQLSSLQSNEQDNKMACNNRNNLTSNQNTKELNDSSSIETIVLST